MVDIDLNNVSKAEAIRLIAELRKITDKGVTSKDSGRKPKEIVPNNPAYMHMKKSEVIEAEKKRREKALRMKEYEAEIDAELKEKKLPEEEPPIKPSAKPSEVKGKKGRPKKI